MATATYEKERTRQAGYMAEKRAAGRDIGDIPECVNPLRRAACERDFRLYCETYFPGTFPLGWSPDHLKVIGQVETVVLDGGQFATAMPRGSGKTSIAEVACTWALSYGHRKFPVLIGSDESAGGLMLDSIKTELESNDLLLEDFPEVCHPIRALDGIAHRCNGQTCDGERTHIGWTADEVILPTIPGSKASGAILKVAGITGRLRGMKHKLQDGTSVRPDLVIVDDPQTDQSARSISQCETRERILSGAILGLAGPGRKIAAIVPCTVIRPGDMADRILNRQLHPEWQGTRTKLVYSFPRNEKLWEEYGRIRAESLRAGRGGVEATGFYRDNREAMDEGAAVAWDERFNPDELSALQHAMNWKLRDERAFSAEGQNEPLPEQDATGDDLTADQIQAKLNRMPRGTVPVGCSRVTAFIDVQASSLFWAAVAWEDDFTGYVADYGVYPEQPVPYFQLREIKRTLADVVKATGLEGQIYGGLEALTDALLSRAWTRDDGAEMRVERCPIDANWGASTDTVYQFCRQSKFAGVVMPSHGKYIGASSTPMREWKTAPGDRLGLNWKMPNVKGRRAVRYVLYDTNYWKTFVHTRLSVAMGDRGCLSLFGARPDDHRLLADHLTAEYRVRTTGRGREVDEWKVRPDRPDNHWLDCVVGCAVAASIQGVSLPESSGNSPAAKTGKVSFAELQRRRRGQPPAPGQQARA